MIIDDAIAAGRVKSTIWWERHQWDQLVSARRRAESFVFSSAASRLAGQFAAECGDLVLRHRQFAIPPFHDTYVEYDAAAFTNQLPGAKAGLELFKSETHSTDGRVGYLITGQRVFDVVSGKDDDSGRAFVSPLYWTLAPPGQRAPWDAEPWGRPIVMAVDPRVRRQTAKEIADGEWNMLACALGSTVGRIHDEDERQSILAEAMPHWRGPKETTQSSIENMLRGGAGEIRNLWTLLLWLNRPSHVTYVDVPASRRFVGGRQVAYKKHRVVEIDLGKRQTLRRAFVLSGERLSPRRHRVRGAFHHHGGTVGCSHDWPLTPDVDGRWQCKACGRLRWWVKDHVRGDATKGWVDHTYAVGKIRGESDDQVREMR